MISSNFILYIFPLAMFKKDRHIINGLSFFIFFRSAAGALPPVFRLCSDTPPPFRCWCSSSPLCFSSSPPLICCRHSLRSLSSLCSLSSDLLPVLFLSVLLLQFSASDASSPLWSAADAPPLFQCSKPIPALFLYSYSLLIFIAGMVIVFIILVHFCTMETLKNSLFRVLFCTLFNNIMVLFCTKFLLCHGA